MKRLMLLALVSLMSLGSTLAQKQEEKEKDFLSKLFKDDPTYLFCTFTEANSPAADKQYGLNFVYSYDGLLWKKLNNGASFFKPTVGNEKLFRDPSIVKDSKGVYHMVWSTGLAEKNLGYARSTDLIHWTDETLIPVMANEPNTAYCMAPELYYHKWSKSFYLVWSSSTSAASTVTAAGGAAHTQHLYSTTTKDFKTFAPTKLFYDPGYNTNDPFIFKQKGAYYLFLKNENTSPEEKNIRMVTSLSLKRFPTTVLEPLTGKEWSLGPSVIKIGKYVYLYYSDYRKGTYRAMRCKNLSKPEWEEVSQFLSFPSGTTQGTVIKVDSKTLRALQSVTQK